MFLFIAVFTQRTDSDLVVEVNAREFSPCLEVFNVVP